MSKYDALAAFLDQRSTQRLTVAFAELDQVVSGLPPSARSDRTWWGNTMNKTRVQAHAWLGAGWRVKDVDLVNERVTFERTDLRSARG